jgi:hypothetical protein
MIPIRLLACITLSLDEEFRVQSGQLPERLEGYTSHDQMFGPVKDLLESHGLPWTETFVSLFILLPGESTEHLHSAFGYPLEVKVDEVIHDVVLACSKDVQNWIQRGTPPKVYANLSDKTIQAKLKLLRDARDQSDNGRAEARMNRALRLADFRL